MPGIPVKATQLPEWADPQQSSVFDPLYKTIARKTVSTLGLDDPNNIIMGLQNPLGSVVGNVAKRVAPWKATKELLALLKGKSHRVDPVQPLSEESAKLAALLQSRHGGAPGPKSVIRTRYDFPLQGARRLSRDPEVAESWRNWANLHRVPEDSKQYLTVPIREGVEKAGPANKPAALPPVKRETLSGGIHEVTKGSTVKPMTGREIIALRQGPVKAFQRGAITKEEMTSRLAANEAKIMEHIRKIKELDLKAATEKAEQRIAGAPPVSSTRKPAKASPISRMLERH